MEHRLKEHFKYQKDMKKKHLKKHPREKNVFRRLNIHLIQGFIVYSSGLQNL